MRSHSRPSRGVRTCGATLLLCALPIAHAATFTVNTAIDPASPSAVRCNPGNANTCSLRDAVAATRYLETEDGLILFDPSVTQVTLAQAITLNTTAGTATTHVIDGGGRVVIDGGGSTRLFSMAMLAGGLTGGGRYRLVGLTLRNGSADAGGALYRPAAGGGTLDSHNNITLDHCRIENNHATDVGGAIRAGGNGVTVIATTFSGNTAVNAGGAIWASSQTSIDASTFVGNSSGSGGAVFSTSGGVAITNSTLTGNVATQTNSGGGIYSDTSRIDLTNVTLWSNPGRSLVQFGSIDINNPPPPSTIRNTLVEDCAFIFTTNVSGSSNLTSDGLCLANVTAGFASGNPQLGALADNGGPTQTLMPGVSGAAVDAGDDAICAAIGNRDQRGAPRPFGARCDIGAVEAGAGFTLGVSVVGDGSVSAGATPLSGGIVDCASGGGSCSAQYSPNVVVPLTVTPGSAAYFAGWSGDTACASGSVVMDGDHACTASFASNAVAGTVSGLVGNGLSLHLDYGNGSEDLPVSANATAFAFAVAVPTGATYSVGIGMQPANPLQTCAVTNADGTVPAGGVDDVIVSCALAYTIGGSVSGLGVDGLVLGLDGGDDLPVAAGSSHFTFASVLASGSPYSVTIRQQPPGEHCTLANASGTVADADVDDIEVACIPTQAHLVLSVSDGIEFAQVGRTLEYTVTLANDGNADATAVAVSATYSAAFDVTQGSWSCIDGGNGATCAASGSGAFADSVDLPANRALTWIVRAPIRSAATESTADFGVDAADATSVADSDTLVLFRDGWDAVDANTRNVGWQSGVSSAKTNGKLLRPIDWSRWAASCGVETFLTSASHAGPMRQSQGQPSALSRRHVREWVLAARRPTRQSQ